MTTLSRLLALSAAGLALTLAAPLAAAATGTGGDEECAAVAEQGAGTPTGDCDDDGGGDDAGGDAEDEDGGDLVEDACAGDGDALEDEPAGDEGEAEAAEAGEPGDDELLDEEVDGEPLFRDFCEPPAFDRAFLARTWQLEAEVEDWSGSELVVSLERLRGVPPRWRDQAEQLEGLEAVVAVGRRAPVTHRRRRRVPRRALGRAREVIAHARLLAPADWARDGDGLLVPTARARGVRIVR